MPGYLAFRSAFHNLSSVSVTVASLCNPRTGRRYSMNVEYHFPLHTQLFAQSIPASCCLCVASSDDLANADSAEHNRHNGHSYLELLSLRLPAYQFALCQGLRACVVDIMKWISIAAADYAATLAPVNLAGELWRLADAAQDACWITGHDCKRRDILREAVSYMTTP
ncbi:hypothetical protein PCL_08412 [Purpureocillium lilacinum]|uniref:Uncharacterized protein n=1 Tax=Purpureocillium lilacinum TaxID=33203 RepID=A0A2U3DRS1_PURLI|nr:hypothetical protein PCL_08412 [Purpureocillium lilacinum]